MLYIEKEQNPNGTHNDVQTNKALQNDNYIIIPLHLKEKTLSLLPYVNLIYDDIGNLIDVANNAEARPNELEELREQALQRISGKCSAAIKRGLDIGDKHYSFSQLAQSDIAGCMQELRNGASVVPYRADGENDYSPYNLEQMTIIYTTMSEWIKVNTQYKATLKKWITREENKDVLNSIDYGVLIPDDLLHQLDTHLAVYGVDINKYAAMLRGDAE